MKIGDNVMIYDEIGRLSTSSYVIIKMKTNRKNVFLLKGPEGERFIDKSRVVFDKKIGSNERKDDMGKDIEVEEITINEKSQKKSSKKAVPVEDVNIEPVKKISKQEEHASNDVSKPQKSLVKYDLNRLPKSIFKKKEPIKNNAGVIVESYAVVSDDGKEWAFFNLYDGSIGKKNKDPKFMPVSDGINGDLKKITDYLSAKGYLAEK